MSGTRPASELQPAVLIADPSKVTLVAARKLLEPHFSVYLAEDGIAAWELLESIPEIAAVFTDQNLPRLDGHGLLARIRTSAELRIADLPVIVTTSGDRNESTRRAAVDAGATDFIIKPFDSLDLLTRARAWCSTSQRSMLMREDNNSLRELVLLDAETRAGNRSYFLQEAIKDRSFCMRHRGEHTLVYITIDHFDRIMREHGRIAARDAVALTADAIRAKCRREDTFARVGDSAFALSLLHTPSLGARVLAERIRQAIAQKVFKSRGMAINLTVSIGISASPADADIAAGQLLDTAERSAAIASRAGGNQVHVDATLRPAAAVANAPVPQQPPATAGDESAINVAVALADPATFIGELLPVLQELSDAERLILIDRLLVMSETSSGS
ncbi:MAG: GGDEF domain-containing protein [Gammaproteobacteria bacterium]